MSTNRTGVIAHDNACAVLESTRQATVGTTQASAIAAEVTYFRAMIAQCVKDGTSPSVYLLALRTLVPGAA